MFNWFTKKTKKEDFEQHKSAVQTALNSVKQEMTHIGGWIKHLHGEDSGLKKEIEGIKEELYTIKNEIQELKEEIIGSKEQKVEPLFKQRQTVFEKQTDVYDVQTAVQTAVQAGFLNKLSLSERAIISILLNTDMKLSYEDLAAMTGKDSTTVRGQINTIRQKAEGVIEEQIEKNNKKRLYIPGHIKALLSKKTKNRQKREKREEEIEN